MALTRRALGGLTIGGSAALTLAACGGNEDGEGGSGKKEIVWAISSAWTSWNENTQSGNNSYGHQAMTPMTPWGQTGGEFAPDGEFHYDDAIFAAAPELVSEAPMQIKYTLNENAQWSDGNPVRLEDFIFQWYSVSGNAAHANQEKALPASIDWGSQIASIEQAEDGTILVTYVEGYSDPEWLFSSTVYLPSHIAEANGFADWQTDPEVMGDAIQYFEVTAPTADGQGVLGTGPYKVVDAKLGEYVVYEINENYQGSIKPTIEKLTLRVIEGSEAITTEMRQGTIDGAWPSEFSEEENAKIAENPDFAMETYAGSVWQHFDSNTQNKFLKDVELRKAVFTAINVQDICDKNYPETGVQQKLSHFFLPDSPYWVDHISATGQGSGDVEAANAILTAAGYTTGETLMSPDGEAVTFNMRYADSNPVRKLAAELAQASLAEIGIALELVAIPDGELGNVLAEADFDLIIFGWIGSAAFTVQPSQYFHSESGSNYGKYSNPVADEAIDKVRSTFDLDEAAQFTNDVDAIVAPDAYTLPLFDEPQVFYVNKAVLEGPVVNPASQAGPLWNIREWKIV
ncbi:peptide/nickel transport system substrate-binding protein [Glycomyces sambucus]|uniref:Peptide/nickel transport system substrate-binding protein n=1 Tax=Glycomyces sambucus TaxID=380244 RepID=A0A1G9JL74_9ACTN|nr:ABC transporter family substrate-binding protein [Glycomyces sambucus]SDL38005.1 peptide/nickel transport system substrate-binding protein [Glycomyces sambucus]